MKVRALRPFERTVFGRTFSYWGPMGSTGELPPADAAFLYLIGVVQPLEPLADADLRAQARAAFAVIENERPTTDARRRLARLMAVLGIMEQTGGEAA